MAMSKKLKSNNVDRQNSEIILGGTAKSPQDAMALHDIGLGFAEVSIGDPSSFKAAMDKWLRIQTETGLLYLAHGPKEGNPNDINVLGKEFFPRVLEALEVMPILSMPLLTLHFWMDHRFVKPNVVSFKIGLLKRITDRAYEKGIAICLENLSENTQDLARAFDRIPHLNLTLDVGHAQLLRETNTSIDLINAYPRRIKHIHLHDNYGGYTVKDDLHLPPGKGIVDFKTIFNSLKSIGYAGTMSLELKPQEIISCLAFINTLIF